MTEKTLNILYSVRDGSLKPVEKTYTRMCKKHRGSKTVKSKKRFGKQLIDEGEDKLRNGQLWWEPGDAV